MVDSSRMKEDPRKTGLKSGIRQLTDDQIRRTLEFPGEMAVDHGNYVNGCYCPLAIGVGLDKCAIKNPTNDSVSAILCLMGYKVNNTRGIKGEFFTTNRLADYKIAANEVLQERKDNEELELIHKTKPLNEYLEILKSKELVDGRYMDVNRVHSMYRKSVTKQGE